MKKRGTKSSLVVAAFRAVLTGNDTGSTIFDQFNTGSGNTGFGLLCATGGIADGFRGTITGNSGATYGSMRTSLVDLDLF